ncbi:MAG: gamma carbonic anhydrase family protein [SAR202 cluster bacterium]|nr:gamma carbonic anhydrase family protein [SAR202 cluster bacterium]
MIRSLDEKTPRVHPTAFVSEAAYIVGDVTIGENSSVWPGAVLRGDYGRITVGSNTNIQDNCVLHADDYLEVGDNVTVTHGAVLHCHKVGSNVMIGVNAVLLENAEIGDNCVIGAGAVVLANTIVPPNSVVVGVPGKIHPLKPKLKNRINSAAEHYKENAKRFKAAGLSTRPKA